MKTILLPTDFSKNSLNAIHFAMEMFKDVDCTFYVLNIQKASSFVSDDLLTVSPSVNLYQAIIDTAKKSLHNLIVGIKSKHNNSRHEFIPIVDYDNFIDAINQICDLNNIDMIIMGTKGASGLEKVIFGSNTVRVLQRGKVPIIAIPDHYKYKKLNQIVFISNYLTKYEKEDLAVLLELIQLNHSTLDILHVSQGQKLTNTQEEHVKLIEELFKNASHKFVNLKGDAIFKEVHDYLVQNKSNLLAMVNKRHSFFERFFTTHTVEEFGFNSEIPLLVLPKQ